MKHACLAALLSLGLAAPAHAVRPSYSYFDAAYLKSEIDNSDASVDGLRLQLDYSLGRWIYFTGEHDRRAPDDGDIDALSTSLGLGVHSLNSKFQLFAAGTYERTDVYGEDSDLSRSRIDDKEEGYGVQLGARLPFADRFELQGSYKYVNYGDLPNGSRFDEDRYRIGALAHIVPGFAVTASYEMFEQNEDLDQWTIGLRAFFKNRADMPLKKRRAAAPSVQQEAEAE